MTFNNGMPRRAWTREEEELLSMGTAVEVAAAIGRTVAAVHSRRSILGIRPEQRRARCGECGGELPADVGRGRPREYCPDCAAERIRESTRRNTARYRERNPEHYSAKHRRFLLMKKYGLTPEDYDLMLAAQAGGCAICGAQESDAQKRRFHIDHDHATGAVRGLLCGACNTGIGQLKDDPTLMRAAADYIERNRLRVVAGGRG